MRNVHFYFLKLFGCQILEGKMPIDLLPFSEAILRERPHPNVYLAFGPSINPSSSLMAGASDVHVQSLNSQCVFATWFYDVGNLSVNVMYARDGEKRDGLLRAWHPRFGYQELVMTAFLPPETVNLSAS